MNRGSALRYSFSSSVLQWLTVAGEEHTDPCCGAGALCPLELHSTQQFPHIKLWSAIELQEIFLPLLLLSSCCAHWLTYMVVGQFKGSMGQMCPAAPEMGDPALTWLTFRSYQVRFLSTKLTAFAKHSAMLCVKRRAMCICMLTQ